MSLENKIEKTLREERGDKWVMQAKREAMAYQAQVKEDHLRNKLGSYYLTRTGSLVRLREVKSLQQIVVEFPTGLKREVQSSQIDHWIPVNRLTLDQLSNRQQLEIQIQVLQEQKRRVNSQDLLPEDKKLTIKGIELSIQALQNLYNPNNQW